MIRRRVVLFGIQPSGNPHLGNYLCLIGACASRPPKLVCCVADLHALTSGLGLVQKRCIRKAAAFLLAVMNTRRINAFVVYAQSAVKSQVYLSWVAACGTKYAELERASSSSGSWAASVFYPSLMAADVLACRPTHLAVGLDQLRHLEVVKLIARRLNLLTQRALGEKCALFPEVKTIAASKLRLMCLRVPKKKMSKSATSSESVINVLDDYNAIKLKVVRSRTDCCDSLPGDTLMLRNRSGVASLIGLYAAVASTSEDVVVACVEGTRTQRFKTWLTKLVYAKLRKTRRLTADLIAMPEAVDFEVAKGSAVVEDWASRSASYVRSVAGLS
ncbi:MAG: hypothetical protein ACKESB_01880 [Candidatus Hodgkinia cicadicola]